MTGNFWLVLIPDRQQHVFGVVEVAALFTVIILDVGLDDGVRGAALFAEPAENALGQINVVASGAAGAVLALFGFDGNGQRGADGFTKLAGNAAFFAIG